MESGICSGLIHKYVMQVPFADSLPRKFEPRHLKNQSQTFIQPVYLSIWQRQREKISQDTIKLIFGWLKASLNHLPNILPYILLAMFLIRGTHGNCYDVILRIQISCFAYCNFIHARWLLFLFWGIFVVFSLCVCVWLYIWALLTGAQL